MKRLLLVFALFFWTVNAFALDSDRDGVDDSIDLCYTVDAGELGVDANGCGLMTTLHFRISP